MDNLPRLHNMMYSEMTSSSSPDLLHTATVDSCFHTHSRGWRMILSGGRGSDILWHSSWKMFFFYWRLPLSFWGIFGSSTIILLGWGQQEQAWLALMSSSNDSYLSLDFWVVSFEFTTLLYYYIFINYLSLALTSCRASLISFCGDEEQK